MTLSKLTPKEIVKRLDKYIIGQEAAKRSVAIAVRNRWRREKVKGKIKEEIMPANLILIGPTGVGKTEIARRLAYMVDAPFIKVEASKFTEVGYVGRDVESMIRDLMNISVNMVKSKKLKTVQKKAQKLTEEKILDLLLPGEDKTSSSRERLRNLLRKGKLNRRTLEIQVEAQITPIMGVLSPMGMGELDMSLHELMNSLLPKTYKKRRVTVKEAKSLLYHEVVQKLIDMDEVVKEAKYKAENYGIIFLDEIDKLIGSEEKTGPDVSRTGVQRDLLPIVEGSSVMTKYGIVKTDHILFFAAGAFSSHKPSELIPELQGRFPIRVELSSLGENDFYRILIEPENALTKQYKALFKSEGVTLNFTDLAIKEMAHYAYLVNETTENIGARRLQTIITTVLEEYLYSLPSKVKTITITEKYVKKRLEGIVKHRELSKYIL
jgi:ATP-dependent HslUV protease ATP-binding subunit HslU